MPTSVALDVHFEDFIKAQLGSGRYNNASEVVRAGLRLLEEQEQLHAARLVELRSAVQAGIESGEGRELEDVIAELRAKRARADQA